jgi:predicted ATPase/DNA-binding CsgD family transcriptional regulator
VAVDQELFADSLPTYLTRFVGREQELDELVELAETRLLTICGMGGIGKTRLAVQLATRLRTAGAVNGGCSEVHWAPLAAVRDPVDVPAAVAEAVGLRGPSGSRATVAVVNALRGRSALLVLDNCEHLTAVCREVVQVLLGESPDVKVLVTSRVPLILDAEQVFSVPPMRRDAMVLFVDRAAAVAPAYALTEINTEPIDAICRRLDGLPLAIELAAGWIRVLAPRDLLSRLDSTLNTVASEGNRVEERQRNIHAVLDGTWQWLHADDRRALTAMGVFVGGFTLDAAEAVAQASLSSLATLTERSLIQRIPDPTGGSRYQVHELVRGYALSRLEAAGQADDAVRTRHFDYYLRMAEGWDSLHHTPTEPEWNGPVAAEQGNLDAALNWALDRGDAERALRIIDVLGAFYVHSIPRSSKRVEHTDRALALPWSDSRPDGVRARAKALNRKGHTIVYTDPAGAERLFQQALKLFADVNDQVGVAASMRAMGWSRFAAGEPESATRYTVQAGAHAHAIGDTQGEAWSSYMLGGLATGRGELQKARRYLLDAVAGFERNRAPYGNYRSQVWLAEIGRLEGRWSECLHHAKKALTMQRTQHFTTEGGDLLEVIALATGALARPSAAARLMAAAATWRISHEEVHRLLLGDMEAPVARLTRQLGEQAWMAAYAEGQRLSPTGALDLAENVIADLTSTLAEQSNGLTAREAQVLRLLAGGLSNAAIAERLVLSPRTVHAHLRSIYSKLGVSSRTAAAHEAVQLNLA